MQIGIPTKLYNNAAFFANEKNLKRESRWNLTKFYGKQH